ncbi:MAG: DUF2283 domain-containing protein [Solirubrobacterales bacterium]
MQVKIGNLTFDHARYDSAGDVLYLHVGEPRPAAYSDETPEGHVVRHDDSGNVIGLTLISAKRFLDRDGEIVVTMPETQHVPAAAVEALLAA